MRPIKNCFNQQLATLCQHTWQLEALSKQVALLLPQALANSCQVASYHKGCLLLTTQEATWAAQLRFALFELRDTLRQAGWYHLTSIKINLVEPPAGTHVRTVRKSARLSPTAKAAVLQASHRCTFEPLKKAWLHLGSCPE